MRVNSTLKRIEALRSGKHGFKILVLCTAILAVSAIAYASTSEVKVTTNMRHDAKAKLSVDGENNIHVVYQQSSDYSDPASSLHYKKMSSDGKWGAPVKIASEAGTSDSNPYYWGYSDSPVTASDVSVASNKGKAFVAYMINDGDQEVVIKSNTSGTWPAKPRKLTDNSGWHEYQPSMAQYNGRLYVVFVKRKNKTFNNSEIYFMKKVDGKWTEPIALTNNTINDTRPNIYAKGGKLYVAWLSNGNEKTGWRNEIKYRFFSKGRWSGEHTVYSTAKESLGNPTITVASKTYIAYTRSSNWDSVNIGLSYFDSGTWKSTSLTSNPSSDISTNSPRIASYGDKLGIIWSRSVRGKGQDLWYAYKDNASSSWKRTNISNTEYTSELSNGLSFDSKGNGHIVFSSDEDGDSDIHYLKK